MLKILWILNLYKKKKNFSDGSLKSRMASYKKKSVIRVPINMAVQSKVAQVFSNTAI